MNATGLLIMHIWITSGCRTMCWIRQRWRGEKKVVPKAALKAVLKAALKAALKGLKKAVQKGLKKAVQKVVPKGLKKAVLQRWHPWSEICVLPI